MTLNPVISILGRRLRLAVIGGGPGSFIGNVHRLAARLDNYYELVCGVLSSSPENALNFGKEMGFVPDRRYGDVQTMLAAETRRDDGADVVAIMSPNDSHYGFAMASLDQGFDVICDKPMTNTIEHAEKLYQKVTKTGLIFCLTHNYTGYPMVRQARAMVEQGFVGNIRMVQVEYVQGCKAAETDLSFSEKELPWRYDLLRGGPSVVMGDIGTHAHHLVRFITRLEVKEVAAEVGTVVPGRKIDDVAAALLRFENRARGCFWVTQAAAGIENCLKVRICGSAGTLEWAQEIPQRLIFRPLNGPVEIRTPNGPGTLHQAESASRINAGHPEGFHDAFANIYSDAAMAIAARRAGIEKLSAEPLFPDAHDGLQGLKFVHAVIESSKANGRWTECS